MHRATFSNFYSTPSPPPPPPPPFLTPSGPPSVPLRSCSASLVWCSDCQQRCTAVQAIKDAEADERIADQLAALQLTLSQLADQEEVANTAEAVTDVGNSTTASPHSQVLLCDVTSHDGMGVSTAQLVCPEQLIRHSSPVVQAQLTRCCHVLTAVIAAMPQGVGEGVAVQGVTRIVSQGGEGGHQRGGMGVARVV